MRTASAPGSVIVSAAMSLRVLARATYPGRRQTMYVVAQEAACTDYPADQSHRDRCPGRQRRG